MKNILRKSVCILMAALLLLPVLPVSASTSRTVTCILTDRNGEQLPESTLQVKVGDPIVLPDYQSNKTQTFSGWHLENGDPLPATMPDHDLTVYGVYTWVKYTVTYHLDGVDRDPEPQTYHYTDKLEPPEVDLDEGWAFSGWELADGPAPDIVLEDLTLYGSVYPEEYTLNYVLNGKYLEEKTQTYYFGDKIAYCDEYDNIEGSTFSGWFKDSDLSDAAPATMPSNDMTVYGKTEKNSYTVTYYLNNTKLATEHTFLYGDEIVPLSVYDNVTGYTFSGWHQQDGSQVPATMPAYNLALYAEQTPILYTLTYYLNGTYRSTQTYTYNQPIHYISDYDDVPGSTFSGWHLLSGEAAPTNMPAANIIVYGEQTTQEKTNVFGGVYNQILQGESFEMLITFDAPHLQSITISDIAFDEDIFILTDMQWLCDEGTHTVDIAGCSAYLTSDKNINVSENVSLKLTFSVNSAAKVGNTQITFRAESTTLKEAGNIQVETVVSPASVQVICGVHDFTGEVTALNSGTHSVACKNGCGESISEQCFGGTATCLEKAKCTVCKSMYGFKKSHSYTGAPRKNDNNTHSYMCVNGCEQYGGEHGCSFGFATSNRDNTTHEVTCTVCSNTKDENCYGGEATCETKAICTACKEEYGECKEHEYTGTATAVGNGRHQQQCINGCNKYGSATDCKFTYTADYDEKHIKTCEICAYTIAEYCSGGKASCVSQPQCVYCGNLYGKKNAHSFTGETKTNNNGSHQRLCINGCNEYGEAESCVYTTAESAGNNTSHKLICSLCGYKKHEACAGGTASCSQRAVCDTCGGTYGKTTDHSFTGEYVYNDDNTHSRLCIFGCGEKGTASRCEMTAWTSCGNDSHKRTCTLCLQEQTEDCCGGEEATCDKQSVCEVCDTPYGTTKPHTFADDAACTSNGDNTHNRYCTACEQLVTENCTSEKPATCNKKAVCTFCEAEYGEYAPHTFSYAPETNAVGTHIETCRKCGFYQSANCYGGTATCQEKAVCEACFASYGELAEHDFNGEASPTANGTHKKLCTMGCGQYGDAVECTLADYVSNNDSTHTAKCTVCEQTQTLSCSGGKEICGETSICKFCNAPYGNYSAHNFATKYDGIHHWGECIYCKTETNYEAHTYTTWNVLTEVSYTRDGSQWRMCTTCGRINNVTVHLLGDLDNSLDLSAADARIALRVSVSLENLNETQFENADIDANGTISAADARLILRACVGLENEVMKRYTEVPM